MVLDTSIVVAVLMREPGSEEYLKRIRDAGSLCIGSPTVLESVMVLSPRMGIDARPLVIAFLRQIRARVIPFGEDHLELAAGAFLRFGRGYHRAGLNFGDCLAYAIAAHTGEPLLFIGNDFAYTDITPA